MIGEPVACMCSSDLEPTLIQWHRKNKFTPLCSEAVVTTNYGLFEGSSTIIITASSDDRGTEYKCITTTPYGNEEKTLQIYAECMYLPVCCNSYIRDRFRGARLVLYELPPPFFFRISLFFH